MTLRQERNALGQAIAPAERQKKYGRSRPCRKHVVRFLLAMFILGCRVPTEFVHDTTYVHDTPPPVVRVDTLIRQHTDTVPGAPVHDTTIVTRVDTLPGRIDTVTRTITVPGPPVHDTTIVVRVDTVTRVVVRVDTLVRIRVDTLFQLRTDTLYLPSAVVHDTTWIYLQTNPTNPLAGGDPHSGLMALAVWPTFYLVFWHGHFVGVVQEGTGYWRAYLHQQDNIIMIVACDRPTLLGAIACLAPIEITLSP